MAGTAGALCVLAVMLLGKTTLCHMAEGQLDREYGSGAPYVLWVAMGMQENPDALKGPGTYNDYNLDTYLQAGYDSIEQQKWPKEISGSVWQNGRRIPWQPLRFSRRNC